jgi:aspartate aminotransferase
MVVSHCIYCSNPRADLGKARPSEDAERNLPCHSFSRLMVTKRVNVDKALWCQRDLRMASKDAINLGLGELDCVPPVEVREAYKEVLDQDHNRYGPTKGIDELRELVAGKVRRYRQDIDQGNVIITASGTQGTMATYQTLFEQGDEVLIPDPGFVLYEPDSILGGSQTGGHPLLDRRGSSLTSRHKAFRLRPTPRGWSLTPPPIRPVRCSPGTSSGPGRYSRG